MVDLLHSSLYVHIRTQVELQNRVGIQVHNTPQPTTSNACLCTPYPDSRGCEGQ